MSWMQFNSNKIVKRNMYTMQKKAKCIFSTQEESIIPNASVQESSQRIKIENKEQYSNSIYSQQQFHDWKYSTHCRSRSKYQTSQEKVKNQNQFFQILELQNLSSMNNMQTYVSTRRSPHCGRPREVLGPLLNNAQEQNLYSETSMIRLLSSK